MLIIAAYDIKDNKKRNKIYEIFKNYGNSVQKSIFECNIDKNQFDCMKKEADKFITEKEESLIYYIIEKKKDFKKIVVGKDKIKEERSFYII